MISEFWYGVWVEGGMRRPTQPFVNLVCSLLWTEHRNVEIKMVSPPFLELVCRGGQTEVEVDRDEVAAKLDGFLLEALCDVNLLVVVVVIVALSSDHDEISACWPAVEAFEAGKIGRSGLDSCGGRENRGEGTDVGGGELRVIDEDDRSQWESRRLGGFLA